MLPFGMRGLGVVLGCALCWVNSAASVTPSDAEYFHAVSAGASPTGLVAVVSDGEAGPMGWTVRDNQTYTVWPGPTGAVERALRVRLRDARAGSDRSVELTPRVAREGTRLRLEQRLDAWGVEVEVVLVSRGAHMEGAARLRGLTTNDVPLRVEVALDAPGTNWRWWDDGRRSRAVAGSGVFANLTRVLAGYDGQMSRYPLACLSSPDEALVFAVPLLRPRVFQLVYDAAAAEYRLAVDLALSPATRNFPNEATFFFSLYAVDPAQGFRGAFARYARLHPEAFVKRVIREGIWMPFTRINDVRDAEDFHFGFHEYGAVDLAYNRRHGIYSFLYVEPWTYWMAMTSGVPRETSAAMALLEKNAAEGDAWNRPMARATMLSAIHEADGVPAHQFVDQPWCNGTLFFNNSDPDLSEPDPTGVNAGQLNLDIARREVVERERIVVPGWDAYAEGYRVDDDSSVDEGTRSLLLERAEGAGDRGAVQTVTLDQQTATPIWISGYSRAEQVSPGAAVNYALYADLTYQDGSNSWGHAVGYDAGSHPWQQRELVIRPAAPVKTIKLHALLRGDRTGRVWFDGLELKEISSELAARVQPSPWEPYERGFSMDRDRPHGGRQCIRVDRAPSQAPGGALLRVAVEQAAPAPLSIQAWSRAQGEAASTPNDDYAVFMDVYFADGTAEYGVTIPFEIAAEWRSARRVYEPAKPIRSINLHLLLRGAHTGSVWFDDVSVRDSATGREYAEDGGFERGGATDARAELAALPNRLVDGVFRAEPVALRADGMYLDSLEGWANRLNFRADHFASVDVPLAYETGTGRTAIFNLFSIFEFTRAMATYLHAHDRLLMGNWVLIDFPFLGALLDVPGKEVHWLDSRHAFAPDPDETMLYRRMLSGKKPYPLLLNVKFEHFTPAMMRKFFDRSLFYAFYPGMFSHDAATNPYFENPAHYDRDRDLFLRYIPLVRALSAAGWEPVTHATSSHPNILVERYGWKPSDGLYFALHHDGEEWNEARIHIDAGKLGLPHSVRMLDVTEERVVAPDVRDGTLAFAARLGDYGTRVIRVLDDTPAALAGYAGERVEALRDVVLRHEAQGKLSSAEAHALRASLASVASEIGAGDRDALLQALRRVQTMRGQTGTHAHNDYSRAMAAAENAISEAAARRLGLVFSVTAPESLVSSADASCTVELENNGSAALELDAIRLSVESADRAAAGVVTAAVGRLSAGRSVRRALPFQVPAATDPDSECAVRVSVEGLAASRTGAPQPFALARTVRARMIAGLGLRMTPGRILSVQPDAEWSVEIAHHQTRAADVALHARVAGGAGATLSWTQALLRIEAGRTHRLPLRLSTPHPDRRVDYTVTVSSAWGAVTGALARFPAIESLLVDTNVEVRADSTYAGYSIAPLRDGITETAGLDWSESAWASAELAVPHWVEARWPSPRRLHEILLYWAEDGGAFFRSAAYRLQVRMAGRWIDLVDTRIEDESHGLTRHTFEPVSTDGVRLWQQPGGGHASRVNLLWLREFAIRGE